MAPSNLTATVATPSSQSFASHNELSWLSAFWALVPIALNTMCQPSGRIMGYPTSYNFAIRCSPIVCAISAIDTLVQLPIFIYKERSVRAGLREFLNLRFQDRQGEEEGSFNNLRKNTIFRWVLFIAGALPQTVKLCSCRGIPWTQAWALAYSTSFVIDELLVLSASALSIQLTTTTAANVTPARKRVRDYTVYMRGTIWLSFTVACGYLTHGIFELVCLITPQLPQLHPLIAFALCSGFWICLFIAPSRLDLAFLSNIIAVPVGAGLSGLALPLAFITSAITIYGHDTDDQWTRTIQLGFACLLTIIPMLVGIENMLEVAPPTRQGQLYFMLGTYFQVVHLLAVGLFYGLVYDSSSTYKPSWTEYLG